MLLVHTSFGLFLSGCSVSMYYMACFDVAHKNFPVSCIYFIVILFKSYCKGDNPDTRKTYIFLQFDPLVQVLNLPLKIIAT